MQTLSTRWMHQRLTCAFRCFHGSKFRTTKAGIKLHTLLDLRGNIPSILHISNANWHEVNWLDSLPLEAGAIYLMDRGYLDFARLYGFTQAGAFFVTRAKHNTQMQRVISRDCDKTGGVLSDQEVLLSGHYARKDYPMRLRRVRFKDQETGKVLVFLPTILRFLQVPSPRSTSNAGRLNCFLNGSNSICASRHLWAKVRTPSKHKSGSPSASTCSSPSSKNA